MISNSSHALEDTAGPFDVSRLALDNDATWLVVALKKNIFLYLIFKIV